MKPQQSLTFILTLGLLGLAGVVSAQTPPPAQAAAAPIVPSAPSSIPVGSRVGLAPSSYDDGGRRDPFATLIAPRRLAAASMTAAGPGRRLALNNVALADVEVRGIVRSGATMLAILEGPSKQSYVTRPKDRLMDATIVSIDANGVVFSEQIEGSRAISQVRKSLRPAGEGIR